jgi:ubiquinol-cytochrome c reductase cytochrome c1 subunit
MTDTHMTRAGGMTRVNGINKLRGFLATLSLALVLSPAALASGESTAMASAGIDLTDKASLQRGAGLYMNYCSGCHSLGYQRYSRMAEDLGLTEEQVEQNLMFTGAKFGETMDTGLDPASGEKWLGKAPPDLSVAARTKAEGADWIYNYLKSFYVDESRPMGWNNTVFPGASMPHVLWELQGSQHALTSPKHKNAKGDAEACAMGEYQGQCITGFSIPESQKGSLDAEQYDRVARDISAFLAYVGEPAAIKRESIGVWVVLFLAFLTFLAYLLKIEYWRDVH